MRHRARPLTLSAFLAAMLVVLAQTPAQAATTVGLWHMDETGGSTMTDSSGMGNNGTLSNISFVSPGFDGTGGAYSFNGVNSRVIVPNSSSLNPGSSNITITAHVRTTVAPSSTVGDYDLVRKKGQGQVYKMEMFGTNAQAFCQFKGSITGTSIRKGPNLADGAWHTIACTKTSTAVFLTVDGTQWSKAVSVGSISNTTDLILGGKKDASGDWYNGVMDEVSIVIE